MYIYICHMYCIDDEIYWKACLPNHIIYDLKTKLPIRTEQPVGRFEISFSHHAPMRFTSFCPKTPNFVRSIQPITFTLSVETWALTAVALKMMSTSAGISMSPTRPTQQSFCMNSSTTLRTTDTTKNNKNWTWKSNKNIQNSEDNISQQETSCQLRAGSSHAEPWPRVASRRFCSAPSCTGSLHAHLRPSESSPHWTWKPWPALVLQGHQHLRLLEATLESLEAQWCPPKQPRTDCTWNWGLFVAVTASMSAK